MQISQRDLDLLRSWKKSPLRFIESMWKLKPQPLKPEYENVIQFVELEEVTQDWFEPFQKGKHLTWQQYLIFLAIERAIAGKGKRRLAIESGVGTGKTTALSMLIIWFLFCHENSQIPCTAPTSDQMHDALWKELSLWHEKMPKQLKDCFEWSTEYFRVIERPNAWFARARTARPERPEALAGIHAPHVLAIGDEASGIHENVYRVGEGVLTGENVFVILISQHTRLIGYFHDAFNSDKQNWQNLRFSSIESPVVDNQFVQRIREKYGEGSDEWRVQVEGKPPKDDGVDDKGYVPLFALSDVQEIQDTGFVGVRKMGIDPAGGGSNETIWVIRDDFKAKIVLREQKSTELSITQKTLSLMQMYQVLPQNIYVDNFGVGANIAFQLGKATIEINERQMPVHVNGVNSGNKPENEDDKERYLNMRAVLAWRVKEWVKRGGQFVQDKGWQQLLTVRIKPDLSGKLKVMGKDEMRNLGIDSPDCYDALALTFWKQHTGSYRVRTEEDDGVTRATVHSYDDESF